MKTRTKNRKQRRGKDPAQKESLRPEERIAAPAVSFLLEHAKRNPVSFHMPGHKGAAFFRRFGFGDFLDRWMDCDITEIPGADNLFQTEGILKEIQEAYSSLYECRRSFLLINGSSGGILAALLASVPPGAPLIMARNCHKSVFHGLRLTGARPVYAYPEVLPEYGISGPVSPEEIRRLLDAYPDAAAVILPSPNYYGVCSDIEAIARIVRAAGKILIVDQAHGAHLKLFSRFGEGLLPRSAEESGADIVINSTHKTLASCTQSALLNLPGDRIPPEAVEETLQWVQSTSPSYPMMASLDMNAAILRARGPLLIREWEENLTFFYREAAGIPGLTLIDDAAGLDRTKINFGFGGLGLSGCRLEQALTERNIYPELYTGDLVMCMTGVGNTRKDMERLLEALISIGREAGAFSGGADRTADGDDDGGRGTTPDGNAPAFSGKAGVPPDPPAGSPAKTAGQPVFAGGAVFPVPEKKVKVLLEEAAGRICAAGVIPYPPGIPLVCPGERFEKETVAYLQALREQKEKVIGISPEGEVLVGEEPPVPKGEPESE